MFNVKPKARAFNAGQFAEILAGRTDLEKYAYGCLSARNMLTKPQGPAFRRPGTRLAAQAALDATPSRLIRFKFSQTQQYALEFAHETMRVFTADGLVLDGGAAYSIVTPYQANHLRYLHAEQRNDVLYLFCFGYKPYTLSRYGHTDWRLAEYNPDDGPFLEDNLDATLTLAAGATSGLSVALTASKDLFEAGHAGALFELTHLRPEVFVSNSWTASTTSAAIAVYGTWSFVTHGNWDGVVRLEKSLNGGGTWQSYRSYMSKITGGVGSRNIADVGEEKEPGVTYRVVYEYGGTASSLKWDFRVDEKEVAGIVRITTVTNAKNAVCKVLKTLHTTAATKDWREGAWSVKRGFPRTVGQYKGRLWAGGTVHHPTGMWATAAGDYGSMADGTAADDAIVHLLGDARQDPIYWMAAQGRLLVGTAGSEHDCGKTDNNAALSPANFEGDLQSTYGSKAVQSLVCQDVVCFVARDGRKLLEMAYSFEKDGYSANDLTILNEDITDSGIVEMAYQAAPDARLWCTLANGTQAVLGYDRRQNVIGWTPIDTDGRIESCCILSSEDGEDVIFWATARTIGGQTKRFIEIMAPQRFASQADCYFVDCGLTFDGGPAVAVDDLTIVEDRLKVTLAGHTLADGYKIRLSAADSDAGWLDYPLTVADAADGSFYLKDYTGAYIAGDGLEMPYEGGASVLRVAVELSGLDHLEGKTVAILADGGTIDDQEVIDGAIVLPGGKEANKVHVGLGYRSVLSPMPFEIPTHSGSSPSFRQRTHELILHFYKSLGLKVGPSLDQLTEIDFQSMQAIMNQPPGLYTGLRRMAFNGDYTMRGEIYLVQDEPLPMCILSIEPKMGIET